jgi:hypothetical protein
MLSLSYIISVVFVWMNYASVLTLLTESAGNARLCISAFTLKTPLYYYTRERASGHIRVVASELVLGGYPMEEKVEILRTL